MTVYDITFKVQYRRVVRVEAEDEDTACERADAEVMGEIPAGKIRGSLDVDLYGIETVKADE
jgi:hypothetical protein